jgi:tetratricopeptide (TPR) repeat protein
LSRTLLAVLLTTGLILQAGAIASPALAAIIELPTDRDQQASAAGERVNFQNGIDATEKGDFPRAKSIFEALHKAYPKAPGPYLGLAEVAVRMNDLAGAERILAQAIKDAPTVSELYSARARVLKLQKKYGEAAEQYSKAISLAPDKLKLRLEYADFLGGEGNKPADAIAQYNLVSAKGPSAEAQYGLAFAYAKLKREKDAIDALGKAQKLAPQNPMPSYTLAQLYARLGRNKEALTAIDQSLKLQPQNTGFQLARADILLGQGRYQDAQGAYDKVLKADPTSQTAVIGIGMSYQAMKKYPDAETYFRRALAKDPRQPLILNNLAWMAAERKTNLDQAVAWAKQATALAPNQPAFADTLGWVYHRKGDYRAARTEYLKTVKLHPSALLYAHLGDTEAALGLNTEAKDSYRRALVLKPGFAPAANGLKNLK